MERKIENKHKNENSDNKMDDFIHCFGKFDITQGLCRKHCCVRIQCALERIDQQRLFEMEELEEIMNAYETNHSIQ